MAIVVLVHGTGCGGWVWKRFTPLLRSFGNEVYAPTLSGLADRSHLLDSQINLTTHILDIANLILYEDLEDVFLVGNSYAGMVITGVAARIPHRLKHLIYLDAYLPDDGQSEADLLPAEVFTARQLEADAHGGTIQLPSPEAFGITDPELIKWIQARSSPHPIKTYTEPVHIDGNHSLPIPLTYILCNSTPDRSASLFLPSAEKAKNRGWQVIELQASHLAMLSHSHLLAETIINIIKNH